MKKNWINEKIIIKNRKLGILLFLSLLFFCLLKGGFVFASDLTEENIKEHIIDGFSFTTRNNYNSYERVMNNFDKHIDYFNKIQLSSENPFDNENDLSIKSIGNVNNGSDPLSKTIGPIPDKGFAMSWWHQIDKDGFRLTIKDEDEKNLLVAAMGKSNFGVGGHADADIIWDFYNLTPAMGNGEWHQFTLTSDGLNIAFYMDGNKIASGVCNNPINYEGKAIKYISFSLGHGMSLDEVIIWDKYITENDANLIYNYGSLNKPLAEVGEPDYRGWSYQGLYYGRVFI